MKNYTILFIFPLLCLNSCIDEDFEEEFSKIAVSTTWSVPLGQGEYQVESTDFSGITTSHPGDYGVNYYNDIPFTQDLPCYYREDSFDPNFNLKSVFDKGVESCSFRVNIYNSYPTDVEAQIFIQSYSGKIDSVFLNGPMLIPGVRVNSDGRAVGFTYRQYDIPFENRMEVLENADVFIIRGKIYTQKQGLNEVKFYENESKVKISTAARFRFNSKVNEL